MDILRVLSRGTKKNSKTSHGTVAPLPSAGTATNPQLFHDDVRGKKRKRTKKETNEEEAPSAETLPDVDFFAPKVENAPKVKESRPSSPKRKPAKKLDEDECRQLLRSHRLKLTLLSKPEKQDSKVTKSKKKRKTVVETKEKEGKTQLFPQPLTSFAELRNTYDISRRVAENLEARGYRAPTEVQLGSLPLLLRPELALDLDAGLGEDVDFLAVAPTGSGKTISFLVPAINRIMRRRAYADTHGEHELEALIIAPTRELSYQIMNEGKKLLQGTDIRISVMRRGMRVDVGNSQGKDDMEDSQNENEMNHDEEASESEGDDKKRPQRPVTKTDILVTTPLLLLKSLQAGSASQHVMPAVRDLILDEADVLLDPLFREQTMGLWMACTSPELRISCWSATMGSNIESLVVDRLKQRTETLKVEARPLVRLVVGLKDTAVPNITHKLTYTASEQGKLLALRQLLHPTATSDSGPPLRPPFLVFTQTIDRATALHEELKYDIPLEAGGSTRIAALHSGLSDPARSAIMRKFRAGEVWVLITTDVLARGVDFAGVNGIVNYDVPGSAAAYVHRAGRTGRAGREGGVAVTFYTKEDIPFVKTVANVIAASEKQAGKTGDQASVQKWLLDALPKVGKADRKKLREKGVESRRTGHTANITSRSGWERQREHNKKGAIEGSKKRKGPERGLEEKGQQARDEWGGFED